MFSPAQSLIKRQFQAEELCVITNQVMDNEWSACLTTLEGHSGPIDSVAWSTDGTRLASTSHNTSKIWDSVTGQFQTVLESYSGWIRSVTWSISATWLASISHNTVKIWDPVAGQCQATLEGHSNNVALVAWSTDAGGTKLASASEDGIVKIWDATAGRCQATLKSGHIASLEFDLCETRYLHTDAGTIDLGLPATPSAASPDHLISPPRRIGYGLEEDTTWITYQGQNLIWLPPDYRPRVSAAFRGNIAIGCESGRFLIFSQHNSEF